MIKKMFMFSFMILVFSNCDYFRNLKQKNDSENYKPLPASVSIEFHLVKDVPEEGFSLVYQDGTETLYLSSKPEMSNEDISGFSRYKGVYGDDEVGILFTEKGAEKLTQVTAQNIGHKVAILLNKELIAAPVIKQPIKGGKAALSFGNQKDEKTKKLMELFQ